MAKALSTVWFNDRYMIIGAGIRGLKAEVFKSNCNRR